MNAPYLPIAIRELAWSNFVRFLRLRRALGAETAHVAAGPGQHREDLFRFFARLLVNRSHMRTFIAFDGAEQIGYATILFSRFPKFRGNAYLAIIGVRQTHQNRGAGTALMRTAEAAARARNARRLELEVFAKNEGAIRLYRRLGYEEEGRRRRAVEAADGLDDIVVMAKLLRES